MAIKPLSVNAEYSFVYSGEMVPVMKDGKPVVDDDGDPVLEPAHDATVWPLRPLLGIERDSITDAVLAGGSIRHGTGRHLRVKFALAGKPTRFDVEWRMDKNHPLGCKNRPCVADSVLDRIPDEVMTEMSQRIAEASKLTEDEVGKSERSAPSSGTSSSRPESPAEPASESPSPSDASGDA